MYSPCTGIIIFAFIYHLLIALSKHYRQKKVHDYIACLLAIDRLDESYTPTQGKEISVRSNGQTYYTHTHTHTIKQTNKQTNRIKIPHLVKRIECCLF